MTKRIESIDIIRGFSILGILFMNIIGFHMNEVYTDTNHYFKGPLNHVLHGLEVFFIQNSMYPIFAFLFGFGLSIMAYNIKGRGGKFIPVLYRRVFAMLIFGLIHGYLIFYGDILNTYALMGMIAILFLLWDKVASLIVGIVLMAINMLMMVPFILLALMSPRDSEMLGGGMMANPQEASHWQNVMASGDFGKVISLNASFFSEFFSTLAFTSFFFAVVSILPYILFGIYCHRINITGVILRHRKKAIIIAVITFILGGLIKGYAAVLGLPFEVTSAFVVVGGPLISITYFIVLTLLTEKEDRSKIFEPFKSVGKISFTIYIMQSLLMWIIFYGFKLYGKLDLYQVFIVALCIVIFQLVFAHFYMKKYKQGPLEYVWRKITYLK